MDWWIIGVNRSVDFSCLPTTSAAIRWRDPHFVGWLQDTRTKGAARRGWRDPHFLGWLQAWKAAGHARMDGETPIPWGGYKFTPHHRQRTAMERPPFRGVVTRTVSGRSRVKTERPPFRGVVTKASLHKQCTQDGETPFRGVVTSVGHCLQVCAEMERPHFRGVVKGQSQGNG
jgi:hypothetical protein